MVTFSTTEGKILVSSNTPVDRHTRAAYVMVAVVLPGLIENTDEASDCGISGKCVSGRNTDTPRWAA